MRKIESEIQYREATFERASIDPKGRTAELSFASTQPVDRWFGVEVLTIDESSIDFSRLRNSGPLLMNHDPECLIGVVEKAWCAKDKAKARVRFSRSARGEECWQDVQDGILTSCSVGYKVLETREEKAASGQPTTIRVTRWQPLEVSLVSVPADSTVGVGRSLTSKNIMNNKIETVEPEPRMDERSTEIAAIGDHVARTHPQARAMADVAILKGTSVDDFKIAVMKLYRAIPVEAGSPFIGMDAKEIKRYSIVRAINLLSKNQQVDGLEAEASTATAKLLGRQVQGIGFFVPGDIAAEQRSYRVNRAMDVNTFSAAGALVPTNFDSSMIEILRNNMVSVSLGARVIGGLSGNFALPRQTGAASCYWLPESGTITATSQAVGQVILTPHRLGASTAYTQQLLAQSSQDVESFVRTDLMQILAIEKDRVALNGSGINGEPLGITAQPTTAVGAYITLSGAQSMSFANAVSLEASMSAANALAARMNFVVTPTVRANGRQLMKAANQWSPLWDDTNRILGYPATVSTNMATSKSVIFGDFTQVIIGDWTNAFEIILDQYSLSLQGQVRVVINQLTDVALRHQKAFGFSSN